MKNRRKKKLIRVDLQLKIVFVTLLVTCLVLLINFQLSLAALWSLAEGIPQYTSSDLIVAELKRVLYQKFLLSVGVGVPFAASVGILYSFKFCGPIHRFKIYFGELVNGSWRRPCTLRAGDDLTDIRDAINDAVTTACSYVDETQKAVVDMRAFLDSADPELLAADGGRLQRVKDSLERSDELYKKHFSQEESATNKSASASDPSSTPEQEASSTASEESAEPKREEVAAGS